MAKKNRKRYTAEQKYSYHEKRRNDYSLSENQRVYSDSWVLGYLSNTPARIPRAVENYKLLKQQGCDRKRLSQSAGYINGLKARK